MNVKKYDNTQLQVYYYSYKIHIFKNFFFTLHQQIKIIETIFSRLAFDNMIIRYH